MKCHVCGKRFKLKKENRYEVYENEGITIKHAIIIECFDCPKCGCQNRANVKVIAEGENNDRVGEMVQKTHEGSRI